MRKYDSYDLLCEVRRLREATAKPAPVAREWGEADWMPRIDGKAFRCECGCNVFRKSAIVTNRYKCNSCGATYIGESK